MKRELEQGPVDQEIDYKCKIYESGRAEADPETLRQLAGFSEREIHKRHGIVAADYPPHSAQSSGKGKYDATDH